MLVSIAKNSKNSSLFSYIELFKTKRSRFSTLFQQKLVLLIFKLLTNLKKNISSKKE